jgi:hypothetical protein
LIFIDDEDVFENKPGNKRWGYWNFVRHDKLYSANNQFVKNNVVFLCARIIREDALSKQKPQMDTEFYHNLWSSYNEGLTGECILKVSGEEFKVKLSSFAMLQVILDLQDDFNGSFQGLQSHVQVWNERASYWRCRDERH